MSAKRNVARQGFAMKRIPTPESVNFKVDYIKCPKCAEIQSAKVVFTQPENIYLHKCIKSNCGHIILKDEWHSIL